MGDVTYERLAAQDSSFVRFEDDGVHVHISAVCRFEPRPEPFDIHEARQRIASRLHVVPHSRQRLDFTPLQRHPVWVDDEDFDLDVHVRRAGLPHPGGEAQVRELAEQIISQPLDMSRPLWELTFIEGGQNSAPVVVAKIHHCMVDGVAGVSVLLALLDTHPDAPISLTPLWKPRRRPGLLDYARDRAFETTQFGRSGLRTFGRSLAAPRSTANAILDTASAGLETLRAGLTPPGDTPFNRPVGAQRRVDWRRLDLGNVRDVRKRLDGSINDVVLTVVTGALRRFLRQRRVRLSGLHVRCIVPVDMRTGEEDHGLGNRVSAWFVSLPVASRKPQVRFHKVREQTRRLKENRAERGVDGFLSFADWTGSTQLTRLGVNLTNWIRPYNLIVTNVHGPHFPLYFMGSKLQSFTPLLPLFPHQGLAIAAISYNGHIHVGITADRDLVPDVDKLGLAIDESFAELRVTSEEGR